MNTICYYVSDYGYGHATRSIALIRRLCSIAERRFRLIVCSGRALPFLKQSLADCGGQAVQLEFREAATDIGYCLREGSIEPDSDRLLSLYRSYMAEFPALVERERSFLREQRAGLVISDISPVPLKAASLAKIPSVGLSNFTWYTAYQEMLEESWLQPLYDAYCHMDYFISLPGANEPPWGRHGYLSAGFYCRAPQRREIAKMRQRYYAELNQLTVFFALGMDVSAGDLMDMELWRGDAACRVIVSSNMRIQGDGIIRIPPLYTESQNYLSLADIVITKPGWGTVSEAVCGNKPLLLLERNSFVEDRNMEAALAAGRHPHRMIDWEQLKRTAVTSELVNAIAAERVEGTTSDSSEQLRRICGFLHEWL